MSDIDTANQTGVIIATAAVTFITGFFLGVYSIRGYLISPAFAEERRKNLATEVESEESDIDEDDTILDHAPNWANGEDADRRDGLRARKSQGVAVASSKTKDGSAPKTAIIDANEECKLVLVVRTDLGMTKGTRRIPSHLVGDCPRPPS
jgi:PTH2 family peptidyl-tRNA hydrolase